MQKVFRNVLISAMLFVSMLASAQTNFLGPQKIELDGETYHLVWSAKTHKIRFVEDFLPKKNTISHFSSKVSLDYIATDIDKDIIIKSKTDELVSQKEEGIISDFSSFKADNGDDVIEYMALATDGQTIFVAEWNICRYLKVGKGILLIQMKKREYNINEKKFKNIVEKNREKWIKSVVNFSTSSIKLKE